MQESTMRYIVLLILLLAACGTTVETCWDGSPVAQGCPPERAVPIDPELESLLMRHQGATSYEFTEGPVQIIDEVGGPFVGSATQHVEVFDNNIKVTQYGEFGEVANIVYLDTNTKTATCPACSQAVTYENYLPILPTDLIDSVPTNAQIKGTAYPYNGRIAVRDQDGDIVEGSAKELTRPTSVVQWNQGEQRYWLEIDSFSGLPRRVLVFSGDTFVRGVDYTFFGYETVEKEDVVN